MRDLLGVEVPELLVWIERYREWMAAAVLKPLVRLVDHLHEDVNKQLKEAGAQDATLPSIVSVIEGQGAGIQDATQKAEFLFRRCQAACSGPSVLYHQQEQLRGIMLGITQHQQLLQVLMGKCPQDLLPPSPPTYLLNRIRELARGSCMKEFNWNGGGRWQGRRWSAELPTDSAVVLYLSAAFLDAPGWHFPMPGMPEGSRGTPLYLGSVPGRPSLQYSGLLSYRPDKPGPGVVAVIGSHLASTEPRFSFLVEGSMITLTERHGMFKTLLMFLRYHLLQRQGMVGGRFLSDEAFGGLDDVLAPADVLPTVPQRVFNWWFPAN